MHSRFWDARLRPDGSYSLELDDGTPAYVGVAVPGVLNDGAPHVVSFCRKAGTVYAFVDGQLGFSQASDVSLGPDLAALQTGTSPCVGFDGTVALVGTISDVCVGAL
jgi:hypothetical protein